MKLAKAKRKRKSKTARGEAQKPLSWIAQHAAISKLADIGTLEQWTKTIGVERIDEADRTRKKTVAFAMLAIQDREISSGGIVTTEAAICRMEHTVLDPLYNANVLDDPTDAGRAKKRVDAGIELVRLGIDGKVLKPSTAPWRAVGGASGGSVSEIDAEGYAAHCEMRYHRALKCLGEEYRNMVRSVCVDGVVPTGTRRRHLVSGLDLLAEELLNYDPPLDIVRPKLRQEDRRLPEWLRSKIHQS